MCIHSYRQEKHFFTKKYSRGFLRYKIESALLANICMGTEPKMMGMALFLHYKIRLVQLKQDKWNEACTVTDYLAGSILTKIWGICMHTLHSMSASCYTVLFCRSMSEMLNTDLYSCMYMPFYCFLIRMIRMQLAEWKFIS